MKQIETFTVIILPTSFLFRKSDGGLLAETNSEKLRMRLIVGLGRQTSVHLYMLRWGTGGMV